MWRISRASTDRGPQLPHTLRSRESSTRGYHASLRENQRPSTARHRPSTAAQSRMSSSHRTSGQESTNRPVIFARLRMVASHASPPITHAPLHRTRGRVMRHSTLGKKHATTTVGDASRRPGFERLRKSGFAVVRARGWMARAAFRVADTRLRLDPPRSRALLAQISHIDRHPDTPSGRLQQGGRLRCHAWRSPVGTH